MRQTSGRLISAKRKMVLLIGLLTLSSACSLTKGKATAEAAVVKFHDQFNAGKYQEIYAEADEGFKSSVTEDQWVALLEAVQRKLGSVKESHSTGWGVNTTTAGTMATLSYDVDFSEGKGDEKFIFHITGDKALLYHYNVNSPLLITK
jgi:hypothetical protein